MLDQRSLLGKPSSKDRIMSALLFAQDSLSGGMKRLFQGPSIPTQDISGRQPEATRWRFSQLH